MRPILQRSIGRRITLGFAGLVVCACLVGLTTNWRATGGAAWAQGTNAAAEEPAPKQISLTQKTIDSLIATQKQVREAEAKLTPAKGQKAPDPKVLEAKIEALAKANGFASMNEFADTSYSVGVVLAGLDPESGKYVGAKAALQKQIDEVKADKKMPPNEKKESLQELTEAMKSADTEKPLPANIDIVTKNAAKLNEGASSDD